MGVMAGALLLVANSLGPKEGRGRGLPKIQLAIGNLVRSGTLMTIAYVQRSPATTLEEDRANSDT